MNINLNLYKYFYNVAYYGSYTKAAECLMISQPSLSYSVKVLEKELNKRLFVRGTKGIELTKYGKYLYDKLDIVFQQLQTISSEDNNIRGNITLGVRSAFAYKVLPFYISELMKIYPDLQIDFIVVTHEKMIDLLENDEVDLIIDEYSYDNKYISLELEYNYENVFFTTTSNANKIELVTKELLENYKICIVESNRISKEFEKKYPNYKYIKVQSTPIMINNVKNLNIIGIAPLVLVNDDIEKGNIIKLKTNIEFPKLNMYAVCKKSNKDKNTKAVIDFFKVHFGKFEKSLSNEK